MRTKVLLGSLVLLVAVALMSSCGGMQAQSKENLLSAAGFRMKIADTPQKAAHLQTLSQRKIVPHQKNGQVYYTFADAQQGRLYVGNAQDYQRYQELAAEQRMAREEYMAEEMRQEEMMDWDMWGFYGPAW